METMCFSNCYSREKNIVRRRCEKLNNKQGISKDEQIAAILNGREWEFAQRFLAGDVGLMDRSWTITKQDVKAYIAKHGFPEGWVRFKPQTYDGVYLLPRDDGWEVHYQERGLVYDQEHFNTWDEAMDYLLDNYYLKGKGIA
jgi:hypothetical protein